MCSWMRVAFQLELSSLYRKPGLLFFEGASNLVSRLATINDDELIKTSSVMHGFNVRQLTEDIQFWERVVLGMICAKNSTNGEQFLNKHWPDRLEPLNAGQSDAFCLFGMPSLDGKACCPMACGSCDEETCQLSQQFTPTECC